jgi:hypothetical protein
MLRKRSSIAARCADAFEPAIRSRGAHYHEGQRVVLGGVSKRAIEATVRGSAHRRYAVSVCAPEPGDPIVELACDCPYAAGLEPCKHMWALLLACEACGHELAVAAYGALDVVVDNGIDQEIFPAADEDEVPSSRGELTRGAEDDEDALDELASEWGNEDHRWDRPALPWREPRKPRETWRDRLIDIEATAAASVPLAALASSAGRLEYHLTPAGADRSSFLVHLGWRFRQKDGALSRTHPQPTARFGAGDLGDEDRAILALFHDSSSSGRSTRSIAPPTVFAGARSASPSTLARAASSSRASVRPAARGSCAGRTASPSMRTRRSSLSPGTAIIPSI